MNADGTAAGRPVGVVGAGAMGRGIAQVAAQGGYDVLLYDAAPGAAARGRDQISEQLERAVARRKLEAAAAAAARRRLSVVDDLAALAPCGLVVEAVVEDLEVKRQVFRDLEQVVAADALLTSNTSSLRIAAIAAACERRERIAGMHFFNPVPLMPLVEVIRAPATSAATVEQVTAAARQMGRVPVTVQDSPGFLVNLGGRAFTTEALRIVSEGVCPPAAVDAIMRETLGFRMGPFELMDLTGMDVNFPVSQIIYGGYFHDRRLATAPLHQAMAESGRLGRKSGAGWYRYDSAGKRLPEAGDDADSRSHAAPAPSIVVAEADPALERLFGEAGANLCEGDDRVSPIVCAPLGEDATTAAVRLGVDPARLVAVDLTGDTARHLTVMAPPGGDATNREAVAARLRQGGAQVTSINDSPGFVAQRIAAMIANLGCEMAQIRIAQPADIDMAMKLGLSYPHGPLELGDRIGPRRTLQIMERLQAVTGDDRYRPSLWLRRRGLLDLPLHTPD